MATSKDFYDEQPHQELRPSRARRVPGHLEDYELGYPPKQLVPPAKETLEYSTDQMETPMPNEGTRIDHSTSAQGRYRDLEDERWQRMEACFKDVTRQMNELRLVVDSAKHVSCPLNYTSDPYLHTSNYRPYPHQYSSMPHLELYSPSRDNSPPLGSPSVHGPPRKAATANDELLSQQITSKYKPWLLQSTKLATPKPQYAAPLDQAPYAWPAPVQPVLRSAPLPVLQPLLHPSQYAATYSRPPATWYATPLDQAPPAQPAPQTGPQPALDQAQYATAYPRQPVAQYTIPHPPTYSPYPQSGGYYPQYAYPPVDPTVPSIMDMAIASSFGIPKPKLTTFTTGKESDFVMLKKGLDSVLGPHRHLTEDYKYQVLLDHLELPSAYQVAKRYVNDPTPYTSAMQALQQRYGQPRQLVQGELKAILNSPTIKLGDAQAFEDFSSAVNTLVGMLSNMDGPSQSELRCGSHVDTLLCKLPPNYRDSFAEYCLARGIIRSGSDQTYTLPDLAEWLERKSQAIQISRRATETGLPESARAEGKEQKSAKFQKAKPATVYLSNEQEAQEPRLNCNSPTDDPIAAQSSTKKRERFKPYCPYCSNQEHYLSTCTAFAKLNATERAAWIKEKGKCWRCGRGHKPETCTLKKPCSTCNEQHLLVLHEVALTVNQSILTVNTPSSKVYVGQASHSGRVMLKVVPVKLHYGKKTLDTHAVLDDGSERTIILPSAAQHLGLQEEEEILPLRTIRQDVVELRGASVSFEVSAFATPQVKHHIHRAFTANELSLAEQSCLGESLKKRYGHLRGIPLQTFSKVQPMLLIGSDHPHLITPTQPIRMGPPGGPIAVCTQLGWAMQGPTYFLHHPSSEISCLHTSLIKPSQDLYQHVERLWQLDTLPYRHEKEVTRSKQDQAAIDTLEKKTAQVTVDGVARYATPLLRRKTAPRLLAPPTAVMPLLRATERRLAKNPELAGVYKQEIDKLEKTGYTVKITSEEASLSDESWYIPHHIVHHNGKARIVFNCSFRYQQTTLNDNLLPGPTLGPSLLGVLLRFREHAIAISGDIRSMFHQIRLLPEDQPLLRFLWRDMERERSPDIYEWRVLPFGTVCSPCCAIYALQRHVRDNSSSNEDVVDSVLTAFYVDNCLQSLSSPQQARQLLDKMRALLASGGFEVRQWASNMPEVISHLPTEARSEGCELWLTANKADPQESTLGLRWHCPTDTLGYKHREVSSTEPTMRNVYRVLASQYDPLGYIIPYTTRAKVLVQALWRTDRGWDEPITDDLLSVWQQWESELPLLQSITMPRCYTPACADSNTSTVDLHIFCDSSEKAYGSVAYLRVEDADGHVFVSFVMARSRVAPKRQLSMPRLELSAALTGAQLAKVLHTELTLQIRQTIMWSDSTTVLSWIQSESYQYKVFVGTRVAEIQELTGAENWRYVDSELNPADDITRGKTLLELSQPNRWSQGPDFLLESPTHWPVSPILKVEESDECRKTTFCGHLTVTDVSSPDPTQYTTWTDLLQATYQALHGAAAPPMSASTRLDTEIALLKRAQIESFSEEMHALQHSNPVRPSSRLSPLSPVYDQTLGLIRVGGRLRKAEGLHEDTLHPIVLAPEHAVTKLLVQDYDNRLLHAGPERVFAEIRRTYWILRGRQAIKKHQRQCLECQKWRSKPVVPQMADLPAARLRLNQPPFWSTGVDCFGPYTIRIGRRHEKRWGIIFKCLTTRCVHLDLVPSMDTDSFLLALRRFVARRGKPYEILCDRGTNFRGGERELQEAFEALEPSLKEQLAEQSITFRFNPPLAPHFGGAWEREIKSVKTSLQVILKDQTVSEEVLMTVLIEVEGILNSKPLGYVSSDLADPDPITPNLLLMGRRDSSLPQAVYGSSDLLGRRRWKHSQVLADHFWGQFTRKYLPSLQLRQKWRTATPDLAVGQVVMVVDPQLPRALWPIGRVTRVIPSNDGKIRAAEVDIKGNTYTRPVAKLIELPKMPDDGVNAPLTQQ